MARILIIEDEQPVRDVLRQMLERARHQVIEAADGTEGVDCFLRDSPDLVVTDILMPNKGGLQTIKEILSNQPGAKIIAISGGGPTGTLNFLSTARTFPGVRTLKKPFLRADFLSLVEETLAVPRHLAN